MAACVGADFRARRFKGTLQLSTRWSSLALSLRRSLRVSPVSLAEPGSAGGFGPSSDRVPPAQISEMRPSRTANLWAGMFTRLRRNEAQRKANDRHTIGLPSGFSRLNTRPGGTSANPSPFGSPSVHRPSERRWGGNLRSSSSFCRPVRAATDTMPRAANSDRHRLVELPTRSR